ncbi:MAG: transglycosylase SLT domain-containing protein [Thiolinea sp.]
MFRKYAEQFNLDWRLLAAQAYQESRFDPEAESFAGARGLLQLMPKTARSLGYTRLDDPEISIKAGTHYLDWLRRRFPELTLPEEKLFMVLAAYNAGIGHVQDARRLAKELGKDPDRWFDHVENAMLLLSKKKYYRDARYGYVRGDEPVRYVREIRERYLAYVNATTENLSLLQAAE